MIHGVEPPYQDIRTIELQYGRHLNWEDEQQERRVALVGWEMAKQLFGDRHPLGEPLTLNGVTFTVVGRLRRKDQDSSYSGPDNNKIFVPFAVMRRLMPRTDADPDVLSQLIVSPRGGGRGRDAAGAGAPHRPRAGHRLAARAGSARHSRAPQGLRSPTTRKRSSCGTRRCSRSSSSASSCSMKQFFTLVGLVTLALGGIGVMNIMLIAVKDRTREIGVRKALGATTRAIERQFFLEGFFLTMVSGVAGMIVAVSLCVAVNVLAPLPIRFAGMIITWQTGAARARRRWSSSASSPRRCRRAAPRSCRRPKRCATSYDA